MIKHFDKFLILILFCAFLNPTKTFAHKKFVSFFDDEKILRTINLQKNILKFDIKIDYAKGESYYDVDGVKFGMEDVLYSNYAVIPSFEYGMTKNLSFGFEFPIRVKQSGGDAGTGFDFGFGDATFHCKYQWLGLRAPLLLSYAALFEIKFPSGKTTVGNISLTPTGSAEYTKSPLGNGQYEIILGTLHKNELIKNFLALVFSVKYFFKLSTVAEYSPTAYQDANGDYSVVGSNTVDFGDELQINFAPEIQLFSWLTIIVDSFFDYNFGTKVTGSEIPYFSRDEFATTSSNWAYFLIPEFNFRVAKGVDVYVKSTVPLMGRRYPVMDYHHVVSPIVTYNFIIGTSLYF